MADTTTARVPPAALRDPCVVETQPLAAALQSFVQKWKKDRPTCTGQFSGNGRTQVSPMGAISWLVQETQLPRRTIQRTVAGRRSTTELRIADALVQAIDQPGLFHDGTLEVKPNPRASKSSRASCCGDQHLNGSF